jgi:hypothetical protein
MDLLISDFLEPVNFMLVDVVGVLHTFFSLQLNQFLEAHFAEFLVVMEVFVFAFRSLMVFTVVFVIVLAVIVIPAIMMSLVFCLFLLFFDLYLFLDFFFLGFILMFAFLFEVFMAMGLIRPMFGGLTESKEVIVGQQAVVLGSRSGEGIPGHNGEQPEGRFEHPLLNYI